MIIKPRGGLCNRLRVIFSYYEYAISINKPLIVLWIKSSDCNGYFLDYFEPIPNVTFLTTMTNDIYYEGCSKHPTFLPNYTCLKLSHFMKELILSKKQIIDEYISVHVRRTDHTDLAIKKNKYTKDADFFSFLDKYEKNIYIATDNEETYTMFKQKYNNQIKLDYHKNNTNSLRHTSLQDAIIDIYMCVLSEHFMGSGHSSFSDLIKELRNMPLK
jgi:hypothetical protein